jgi:hypothetical protein
VLSRNTLVDSGTKGCSAPGMQLSQDVVLGRLRRALTLMALNPTALAS